MHRVAATAGVALALVALTSAAPVSAQEQLVWDDAPRVTREREAGDDWESRRAALIALRAAEADFEALDAAAAPDAVALAEIIDRVEAVRTDVPDSAVVTPIVAQMLGDLYDEAGDAERALNEYARGLGGPLGGRSFFNRGVIQTEQAEQLLKDAGVPADADLFDPVSDPEASNKRPVIEKEMESLATARGEFLSSLDENPDPAARESIAAINHRLDELQQMLDKYPPPEDQEQDDSEDEQEESESDEDQEQDQEQQPQDQPEDESEDEEEQEQEPEDEPEEQEQEEEQQQEERRPLRPEEVQRLLDRLEELEEEAMRLAKDRAKRQHRTPEKDW